MAYEAALLKALGMILFVASFCCAVYGITLALALRSEALTVEAYLLLAVFLILAVRVFQTERHHLQRQS
jgi:uncharacterized membrane protein YfcA